MALILTAFGRAAARMAPPVTGPAEGLPLVIGNELFLGGGPRNYGVHVLEVFVQVAL